MLNSLAARVLLASLVLLPLSLGGSGLYLERSHRLSIESAAAERLQLQILTLLAQAEYEDTLQMPDELIEGRLDQANSGIYARVFDRSHALLWQSRSALTLPATLMSSPSATLAAGERDFRRLKALFQLSYKVLWQTADGREVPLVFTVLETTAPVDAELGTYRQHLLLWLGGTALLLLLCQLAILAWGLRPLRALAQDIARLETGASDQLNGPYPREVQRVTDNLAVLLHSEQQRRERVRNTLGDLAHSLKTPLAVIASADADSASYPALVTEQVALMEDTVNYQLQRATGGSHNLLRTVPVTPVVQRLQRSLEKVYAERQLVFELDLTARCRFRGDERDLLEMLGNLMDNACKFCRRTVRVVTLESDRGLSIEVHDDGPGVPRPLREYVTQRGARADLQRPGQGIGLAIVDDISRSYGGALAVMDSPLGGACIRLEFHFPTSSGSPKHQPFSIDS